MTKPKLSAQQVEVLYESHGPAVRRFLIGVLKDVGLAEEAMQQTFTQLMEQGHTARDESMKAWIFKVAFHQAIALRRRAKIHASAVQELALDARLPRAATPAGDRVIAAEERQRAQAALAELPHAQRQVLDLRFRESMTFAQIAERLGVPLGTALTRMRLGLAKLRGILRP